MIRGYFRAAPFIRSLGRPQAMFAGVFAVFSAVYAISFNIQVMTNPAAAESRFERHLAANAHRRTALYGERLLRLRRKAGDDDEALASIKAKLASAQASIGRFERSAELYEDALNTDWSATLSKLNVAAMEDALAQAHIAGGAIDHAVAIYARFLKSAGDEAARSESEDKGSVEAFYADRIEAAADLFAEALKPTGETSKFDGSPEARLASANKMSELGAFYSMRDSGLYASAGLLSTTYAIRRQLLGATHPDTVQIALILGPVYTEMGRLTDAETLYLDAFHAQEKAKGSNSPDLSLYLKLLVDIYQRQGRTTEAQALYEHMHGLFRDAFGAQRYAANRTRDRREDIDRPVSQFFVLPDSYKPRDLVSASDYSVPVSKDHRIDEMKVRLAADRFQSDPREANLPARLAQLMSLCRSESGERISLRSGYRSHHTQSTLFRRNGSNGKTAPPGMSEHQLGLAVDIDVNGRLMRRSDKTYQCFEENAYQYGFILSYPVGNNYLPGADTYEPWHWRYVGVQTAQLYREAGPINKPQEFLAALPCYRERAVSGASSPIGQVDMCLGDAPAKTSEAVAQDGAKTAGDTILKRVSARKLNNGG